MFHHNPTSALSTEVCILIIFAIVKQNQGAGFDKRPLLAPVLKRKQKLVAFLQFNSYYLPLSPSKDLTINTNLFPWFV